MRTWISSFLKSLESEAAFFRLPRKGLTAYGQLSFLPHSTCVGIQKGTVMKQSVFVRANMVVIFLSSFCVMLLVSACAGVANTGASTSSGTSGTNGSTTIVGSVQSVNASAHSVTLTVNGQQYTIGGLSDQEIADLQQHVNKTYTVQVTQNGGSYTLTTGTTPAETDNAISGVTPVASTGNTTTGTGVNEPGSIDFIGKVQSASASSLVINLPNGDPLTLGLTVQTDRSDLNGTQISNGQLIHAKALANPADGSFLASKLSLPDNKDIQNPAKLNAVDIAGVTTGAVGSDNVLHVKVGNKAFDLALNANTEMKDFGTPQAIAANQPVKVNVLYNGSSATLLKVSNGNS